MKILIFLLIGDNAGQTFGWILVAGEIFLRTLGLYFVKELIDDLGAELAKTQLPLLGQPTVPAAVAQV